MQRRGSTRDGTDTPSVPLACVPCRERHVKCDGLQPTCSRCLDSKQLCYYIQSRRGRRPSRKRDRSEESSDSASIGRRRSSTLTVPDAMADGPYPSRVQSPNFSPQSLNSASTIQTTFQPIGHRRSLSRSPRPVMQRLPGPITVMDTGATPAKLRELYYFYFHDSHPVLIPQLLLSQLYQSIMPAPVEAAMHYIGAQYSNIAREDPQHLQRLQSYLFSPSLEQNRFTVQALLLLGIAQRGQDRNDLAFETFGKAIEIAVQLGMHRAAFAQENSEGSVIVQEMWRRVWWELYVNDALLAATRQDTFFRSSTIECDVGLPWEESDYRDCTPGVSRSFKDLDNIAFYEDSFTFSSFSYRVSAARDIAALLSLNHHQFYSDNNEEPVVALDLALNNWLLHLPERKKVPLDSEGRIDEMMYQAHLMTNLSIICLHRPRSNLMFASIQDATAWNNSSRPNQANAKQTLHAAKAVKAADRINSLLTLPGDILKHSPLFTISITMSTVVHLSAYILSASIEQTSLIRDRIALSVGALKNVRFIWPLASEVLDSIRAAAKEVMLYGRQSLGVGAVVGSNIDYGSASMANDSWIHALQDPLFAQVPDLLPEGSAPVTLGIHVPPVTFT